MANDKQNADLAAIERCKGAYESIRQEVGKVIVGQRDVVDDVLMALFCNAHILLVGVPGLAKTLLIATLGKVLQLDFKRVQFTPDLLPGDITGSIVVDEIPGTGRHEFRFVEGPVFTNLLLADEINRTPPKTQAALLQAMQEREVTTGRETRPLPRPFLVMATQNPLEQEGTYPLPEAQLDRFCMKISLGYPLLADELRLLRDQEHEHPLHAVEAVVDAAALLALQEKVKDIDVEASVLEYIVKLVARTRSDTRLRLGASPRGALDLRRCAQALAFLNGRDHVRPNDVQFLAVPVLSHRLLVDLKARHGGLLGERVVEEIVRTETVPG